MTPERWQQVRAMLAGALERAQADRAAYLDQVSCEPSLRREVESLLAREKEAERFLEAPALEVAAKMLGNNGPDQSLIGAKIGSYQVVSLLGAGGMGEVYQAHDTKLGRDVAIKVLPPAFVHDPYRLSRFQREAKMLASLNHPNIATIHGLEQSDGVNYLVMELVPGQTLAERVSAGALKIEEGLKLGVQIAEALEAAHEKGVIHRDLKPANVKVTPGGRVKVLDFGLAKAFAGDSGQDLSHALTLEAMGTEEGRILGTPAYMSPEQARGKSVDKRTDIWAFGCVLYELLTGKAAFDGETVSDMIVAVLEREPEWELLPPPIPAKIQDLLRRCLQKDSQRRLRDIGDARIEIEEALAAPKVAAPTQAGVPVSAITQRKSRELLAWAIAAIAIVIAALVLGAFAYFRNVPQDAKTIRFFVSPPETWTLTRQLGLFGSPPDPLAVSPDGHRIALVATSADGRTLLWVRSLDTLNAQPLAGTEGAAHPFWSPDSRFLGFFAGGKLKKIDVSGGPPLTLCDAPDDRGGAWSQDGVIVFAPKTDSALQKVPDSGGTPIAATVLAPGEAHRGPVFLPDGRHFLYRVKTEEGAPGLIYIASLNSTDRKLLLSTNTGTVVFTQGHLLFLRGTTLMAQPFDARHLVLTGDAFPIAEQIQIQSNPNAGYGLFSASGNGVLAYQTGAGTTGSQLVWFDRAGKQVGTLGDSATYADLVLSPNEKQASVSISDGQQRDIWLYDVARGLRTRFTFDPADELNSVWSPDASRLVFNSRRKGHLNLYQKASSGAGTEEVLLEDNRDKSPQSWSPDGRFILYTSSGPPTGDDLFVLPLSGDRKPVPFLQTPFNEYDGQFSPDGRYVLYVSDESGKDDVYVTPFPGPGGKWQISTAGGTFPRWRRDGTEIFYLAPDNKLMAAAVNGKGSSFEVGAAKPLFEARALDPTRNRFAVSADGQRFLMNSAPQTTSAPITVVLNWAAGLKK
jgi:serine/threonine protein kinase/Tol biopolymer transport system component